MNGKRSDEGVNDMTVFVKTGGEAHDVEVSGKETVGSLYKKAGCAAGLLEGRFKLVWEGEVLDRNSGEEVHSLGLVEGSVVHVEVNKRRTVRLEELKDKNSEVVSELEGLVSADPELVLVVEVGYSPAVEVLSMSSSDLPSGLRFLVVTDSTGCVTRIKSSFLLDSYYLTSVDLILPNVSTIGDQFLSLCENLETIDLNGMTNLYSIGHRFLSGCANLRTINLNAMTNLSSIGDDFLLECEKLETIDLSSMITLSSFGSSFLSGCEKLKIVDLSSMTNLSSVSFCYFAGCHRLETLILRRSIDKFNKAEMPARISVVYNE